MGPLTRSRVEAFDQTADMLTEAAAQWRARAAVVERAAHAYVEQMTNPDGTAWEGQAAGSAAQMAHSDNLAVLPAVDHAHQMADIAHRGGETLRGARAEALEAIADAEDSGFVVGEDLSVTDTRSADSPAQRLARQQQAEIHRSFIAHRVARLDAANESIATKLQTGAARLVGMAPAGWHQPVTELVRPVPAKPARPVDSRATIRAVDNHWKQDPQLPAPVDPKDMTAPAARAAWEAVNAEMAAYNARCGRTFVLPNEQAAYNACLADRGPLLERQAAIRARLRDLGIQVEGEPPPAPDPAGPQPNRGLPPNGISPPTEGNPEVGPASRPSEKPLGGQSLWDENGGEWRYFPGDRWHNAHWDYNPHDTPNSRWKNIPIGDLPPNK
ncbi:hypothetical protein LAUMK13_01370 [Mycobacterium innocens]|uniref:Transmembrane protein n=2 Tax=Mycobacterium innocens TaxID=2341083 RepID=A0A498PV97_9MYCO|nr:hypothetical protein LAUMK13_01370 [Mycobacterium innocens]